MVQSVTVGRHPREMLGLPRATAYSGTDWE